MAYFTDREMVERFEFYVMQLEQQLLNGEDIKAIGDSLPFCLSYNRSRNDTFEFLHVNHKHIGVSGFTLEEMHQKWEEYVQIIHPETIKNMLEYLPNFYTSQNNQKTLSFVQYVQLYGDEDFSPTISFTKPSVLPGNEILWLMVFPDDFGAASKQVEQIIKMDEFKLKHFKRYQQLTGREIEVLKLLINGDNNPRIADKLFISRQTVETHRKNIKRKLNIKSYRDLMKYAFAFDLVDI